VLLHRIGNNPAAIRPGVDMNEDTRRRCRRGESERDPEVLAILPRWRCFCQFCSDVPYFFLVLL
jgi:hypothetical protein